MPEKKWEYFDFSVPSHNPELIVELPFKKDFDAMSNEQKELYKIAEESKTSCIRSILETLKDLIDAATSQKFEKNYLDYSRPFARINEIITIHNKYGSLERIMKNIQINFTKNGD